MSLLFRASRGLAFPNAGQLIADRRQRRVGSGPISGEQAMRSSAVWACLRLRADLISTSPVDVYRSLGGQQISVASPPVLVNPSGQEVHITEWLYSSQVDLDRFGNCFGLIVTRDGMGLPSRIDLLPAEQVTVRVKGGRISEIRCGGDTYGPAVIWHEKQYTVAGLPVGLSALAAAAMSIHAGLSAQQFAADWFAGSAVPAAHLKNTAKVLDKGQATEIKDRFNQTMRDGDVFVTGSDWDYEMLGAKAAESGFLEQQKATASDVCRYLGVPGDLIDISPDGSASLTYANITQRNLQLLIMNLGPAITRREVALSTLTAKPRFVKLNTDAVVLRMDPMSRASMNEVLLRSKQRAPSEVREKDDLPPFTPEQMAEIEALGPIALPPEKGNAA